MSTVNYLTVEGSILYENRAGTEHDYMADQLGSTVALLNSAQAQTDSFTYWPYGETRASSGPTGTPFRFGGTTGFATDTDGGTAYVRARYYAFRQSSWISQAGWLEQRDGEGAYQFCLSSPLNVVDPSGRRPWMPIRKHPIRLPFRGPSGHLESFSYGAYCGEENRKNPGWLILPQDHLDACCQTHDRCLEAHYGAGRTPEDAHKCCDGALQDCADWAADGGGCAGSPDPGQCTSAGRTIWSGMKFLHDFVFSECNPPSTKCLPKSMVPGYSHLNWGNPRTDTPIGPGSEYER